ncbi:MAG TPA: hypothetical protein VHM88_09435 [Candidatus Acidoferrales bacterium]|nr:hypothetical protein [Candidatus Dormibacteraeota bacterium]HEX2712429.1 hypothetical protein [Candidatus Acidoferrales bacterium]
MTMVNGATLRKLIPALALFGVLVFSAVAQSPSLASGGFGYNCGVKGYGYHDHGKVCPNRPFPGQGEGIEIALGAGNTSSVSDDETTSSTNETEDTSSGNGRSGSDNETAAPGNSHGKGHHGNGNGRPGS